MESLFSGKKVALGISGGIAAYKAAEVLRGLQRAGCSVRVGMTKRACEFVQPLTFRALSGWHVVVDDYAPDNPDPIAHITFSQTVDLFVIAPATANIIGKLANGIADDFLTSTYLASTAPVLVAPAMNTSMWHHPATQRNLQQLKADGVFIIEPDEGEMACGTIGPGRLSEPERIVAAALEILQTAKTQSARNLAGEHLLITVGATREAIDPVRFLSNNSSGRMGFAIAEAAKSRGAQVTVVAGSTTVAQPAAMDLVRVTSAAEMQAAVMERLPDASIFIGAAAVADYRPSKAAAAKIKKTTDTLSLKLERTPDILGDVANAKRDGLLVIGFAAETENILRHAREKLSAKNLDAIIANDITQKGVGFDAVTNEVTILTRDRKTPIHVPLMAKTNVAEIILDEIVRLRARAKPAMSLRGLAQPKKGLTKVHPKT
ncbi:MAG TPA: bifunctional phosphopantothenoylcysteine decarboxylase/phosphopantothenate--cysteine ligase CoaBC [Pyrinomonadaceae bacterium]|nr:bifunctional phosphopantothenoylcysteine decarboxylase/phosphopantothenate--cysteine ligase CoaBC [Pyrinomonadaceae bacterium]